MKKLLLCIVIIALVHAAHVVAMQKEQKQKYQALPQKSDEDRAPTIEVVAATRVLRTSRRRTSHPSPDDLCALPFCPEPDSCSIL